MTRRARALTLPAVLALAACGASDAEIPAGATLAEPAAGSTLAPVDERYVGDLPFGLVRCPPFDVISADPSLYRDEPTYVGNEQPTEAIRAWATAQPGFQDVWIDREHRGWVVVGFDRDATARQADLEAEFPGVGVVAVELEHTQADLDQLTDEVAAVARQHLSSYGYGGNVATGWAEFDVPVLDDASLEPFAVFVGEPVCFDGTEPELAVADGPQPESGDGWRLLAVERTGDSYRTGVATTPAQYEALWQLSGVTAAPPTVDFEHEIVIWFGAVYGSGCEIRMDDVVVDAERAIVHGVFVVPGNPPECNADANPEAYLVAVDRSVLPAGPFGVQLGSWDPPMGAPEERTVVAVDLTAPGSTAADDEIGPDMSLADPDERREQSALRPGDVLDIGSTWTFLLDMTCGLDVIGPLNGLLFTVETPPIPDATVAAWVDASGPDGVLLTDVVLDDDPSRLTVTANGATVTYVPAPSGAATACS